MQTTFMQHLYICIKSLVENFVLSLSGLCQLRTLQDWFMLSNWLMAEFENWLMAEFENYNCML